MCYRDSAYLSYELERFASVCHAEIIVTDWRRVQAFAAVHLHLRGRVGRPHIQMHGGSRLIKHIDEVLQCATFLLERERVGMEVDSQHMAGLN